MPIPFILHCVDEMLIFKVKHLYDWFYSLDVCYGLEDTSGCWKNLLNVWFISYQRKKIQNKTKDNSNPSSLPFPDICFDS